MCVYQQVALCSGCMQSNNVVITLYTGKESDVSGDSAIPTKTEIRQWIVYFKCWFLLLPENYYETTLS
jgi:hypothetical protein